MTGLAQVTVFGVQLTQPLLTVLIALLGLLGGLFSRAGKFWLEKRTETQKLRTALLSEIRSPKSVIAEANEADTAEEFSPGRSVLPREVYESRTDDVGLLQQDEIDRVVDYYSTVVAAQEQLDAIADGGSTEQFVYETAGPLYTELKAAERILARRSTRRGRWHHWLQRKWRAVRQVTGSD